MNKNANVTTGRRHPFHFSKSSPLRACAQARQQFALAFACLLYDS